MASTKKKKPKKRRASQILFLVELIVLVFLVCAIFGYAKINEGLRNIGSATRPAAAQTTAVSGGNAAAGNAAGEIRTDQYAEAVQTAEMTQTTVDESTEMSENDAEVSASVGAVKADVSDKEAAEPGTFGKTVTHVSMDADPNADADEAEENEGISGLSSMKGYTNIALVGIDTRDVDQIDYANSDTMIIASINNETGHVRMVSLYRDTLLNIGNEYTIALSQGDSDEEPEGGDDDGEVVYFEEETDDGDGDYEEVDLYEETYDGDDYGEDDETGNEGTDEGNDYAEPEDNTGDAEENGHDEYDAYEEVHEETADDGADYEHTEQPADTAGDHDHDDGSEEYVSTAQPDTGASDNTAGFSSSASDDDRDDGDDTSAADGSSAEDQHTSEDTHAGTESASDAQSSADSAEGTSEYSENQFYNYSETGADASGAQLGETTAAGRYDKANSAYANGSARQLLAMLNRNFDLNIHEYVVVDFSAVAKLVDDLGGIEVYMTEQEVIHMNNYCQETSKVTGLDYTPIEVQKLPQYYPLNGVQAVSYARIRFTAGSDMKRTQRQRVVIQKVVDKAKERGFDAVTAVINDVFPLCKTSFSSAQIIRLAMQVFGFEIEKTSGFPFLHIEKNVVVGSKQLDAVVPVTLEDNVEELHAFLFDDYDYECSPTVKEYSNDISVLTGLTEASREVAKQNSIIDKTGGEADVVK